MDDKTATETRHWRKGQLHCHTLWSDGMTLPEVALETYRRLGYDFVCLSDHELLSSDTQQWREVCPDAGQWPWSLSRAEWERAQELVPGGFDVKKTWRRTFVRLKTIPELQRQFNAAGRFLVVSGEEASCDCHMNTFNVDADIADDVPSPGEWSIEREHISWATASILRAYEKVAKPGTEVKVGDRIAIRFGEHIGCYEVLSIAETVRKDAASAMYRIISEDSEMMTERNQE